MFTIFSIFDGSLNRPDWDYDMHQRRIYYENYLKTLNPDQVRHDPSPTPPKE